MKVEPNNRNELQTELKIDKQIFDLYDEYCHTDMT